MIELEDRVKRQLERVQLQEPIDFTSMDLSVRDPAFVSARLAILVYARDIEYSVPRYENDINTILGQRNQYTGQFVGPWKAQELPHGDFLDRLIDQAPDQDDPIYEVNFRIPSETSMKFVLGGLLSAHSERFAGIVDYIINITGAVHERSTTHGYKWLRQQAHEAEEEDIEHGFSLVIPQESNHDGFYNLNALYRKSMMTLTDIKAANFLLRHFWTPVGVTSQKHAIGSGSAMLTMRARGRDIVTDMIGPIEQLYTKLSGDCNVGFVGREIQRGLDIARAELEKHADGSYSLVA